MVYLPPELSDASLVEKLQELRPLELKHGLPPESLHPTENIAQKKRWTYFRYTLWLFNIAMENGPFIDEITY